MRGTVIVGAGGTGSHVIEDMVNYYGTRNEDQQILLVDGDVVEEKNLLRQGFLKIDVDKNKAESLVTRYRKIAGSRVRLEAYPHYISTVKDMVTLVQRYNFTELVIISCVDNNMARLRLTFAMYAIKDVCGIDVCFIDSGNDEWHGQTITAKLYAKSNTYLDGLYAATLTNRVSDLQGFELKPNGTKNILASIFTTKPMWKENLTKGDYEISCEDRTLSAPQNIATNMTAAVCVLMTLGRVDDGKFSGGEYNFNSRDNSLIRRNDGVKVEDGYENRIQELLDYVKTDTGFKEVFGETGEETEREEEVVEQKEEVLSGELGASEKTEKPMVDEEDGDLQLFPEESGDIEISFTGHGTRKDSEKEMSQEAKRIVGLLGELEELDEVEDWDEMEESLWGELGGDTFI